MILLLSKISYYTSDAVILQPLDCEDAKQPEGTHFSCITMFSSLAMQCLLIRASICLENAKLLISYSFLYNPGTRHSCTPKVYNAKEILYNSGEAGIATIYISLLNYSCILIRAAVCT